MFIIFVIFLFNLDYFNYQQNLLDIFFNYYLYVKSTLKITFDSKNFGWSFSSDEEDLIENVSYNDLIKLMQIE